MGGQRPEFVHFTDLVGDSESLPGIDAATRATHRTPVSLGDDEPPPLHAFRGTQAEEVDP